MSELVFSEPWTSPSGEATLACPNRADVDLSGCAAVMAKQLRAGIVQRGADEAIVRYPCEIFAERDPER